jgi:hypothetical protein
MVSNVAATITVQLSYGPERFGMYWYGLRVTGWLRVMMVIGLTLAGAAHFIRRSASPS